MPIPQFEPKGVLPPGIHDCTLAEIDQRLTWNSQRLVVWTNCRNFLKELATGGFSSPIIVDGGFVTDKDHPSDVDVSPDLRNGASDAELKDALFLFLLRRADIHDKHKVDFCPSFPGKNDFTLYFQYIKIEEAARRRLPPGTRKGILRVKTWVIG